MSSLNAHAVYIRDAIVRISDKSPTSARSTIDGFLRILSPSMARAGDSVFPVNLYPHGDHRTTQDGKWSVLCYHIGAAISSYYQWCEAERMLQDLNRQTTGKIPDQATCDQVVALATFRLRKLQRIAKHGLECFRVDGDIQNGYHLIGPDEETPNGLKSVNLLPPAPIKRPPTVKGK